MIRVKPGHRTYTHAMFTVKFCTNSTEDTKSFTLNVDVVSLIAVSSSQFVNNFCTDSQKLVYDIAEQMFLKCDYTFLKYDWYFPDYTLLCNI